MRLEKLLATSASTQSPGSTTGTSSADVTPPSSSEAASGQPEEVVLVGGVAAQREEVLGLTPSPSTTPLGPTKAQSLRFAELQQRSAVAKQGEIATLLEECRALETPNEDFAHAATLLRGYLVVRGSEQAVHAHPEVVAELEALTQLQDSRLPETTAANWIISKLYRLLATEEKNELEYINKAYHAITEIKSAQPYERVGLAGILLPGIQSELDQSELSGLVRGKSSVDAPTRLIPIPYRYIAVALAADAYAILKHRIAAASTANASLHAQLESVTDRHVKRSLQACDTRLKTAKDAFVILNLKVAREMSHLIQRELQNVKNEQSVRPAEPDFLQLVSQIRDAHLAQQITDGKMHEWTAHAYAGDYAVSGKPEHRDLALEHMEACLRLNPNARHIFLVDPTYTIAFRKPADLDMLRALVTRLGT